MVAIRAFACAAFLILSLAGVAEATTRTVSNLNDSGSNSLRQAISDANLSSGDLIVFQAGLSGSILLTSGTLSVTSPMTIDGSGASITIDGQGATQILTVGANLTLSSLTFTNGSGTDGGAIVQNSGTLTISNSTVSNSNASGDGGGIYLSASGGGATVTATTLVNNSAGRFGGGIAIFSTLTLVNDTFSGNQATSQGGALANFATFSAINTTFSFNQSGHGSAIVGSNSLTLENCVFADNASTVSSGAIDLNTPGGTTSNNVFFNNTAGGSADDGSGYGTSNFVVAVSEPLGLLANNGGPTQTQLPVTGGAAICAGSVALIPAGTTTDQRGLPRTLTVGGSQCVDAGSVQHQVAIAAVPAVSAILLAGLLALFGVRRLRTA